jgi:hypothetical protein
MLSKVIGEDRFGFLQNRQIHDAVAISQEVLHSVKKKNLKAAILKLDLSKAYDRVNWTFLRLVLIQMGMNLSTMNWIMGCFQNASFAVLINGSPSYFFKASRGLRHGCPLSPFLFLVIVEALSRMMKEVISNDKLKGIKVSESETITHLLFVDDVLCSVLCSLKNMSTLKRILDLYCRATGMLINLEKSCTLINKCSDAEENSFLNVLLAQKKFLEDGVKYLGFLLKPDQYRKAHWDWLIRKVESRISIWVFRMLSRKGWLILLKSIFESIPMYWNSIVVVPKGVLEKIRRLRCRYLWASHNLPRGIHLVKWPSIAVPKDLGGWGLIDIRPFARVLVGRNLWCLTQGNSIW